MERVFLYLTAGSAWKGTNPMKLKECVFEVVTVMYEISKD